MSSRTILFKDIVVSKLKIIFEKENINVTDENIKVWGLPEMNIRDVAQACKNFPHQNKKKILVYTNRVSNKQHFFEHYGVTILDEDYLKDLALKYFDYDLYDLLH